MKTLKIPTGLVRVTSIEAFHCFGTTTYITKCVDKAIYPRKLFQSIQQGNHSGNFQ